MTNENKKKRPRQQGKYARKGSKWRKFLHKANVFATKAIKKTSDAAAFMVNKNDVKWYWDVRKLSFAIIMLLIASYWVGYSNGCSNRDLKIISEVQAAAETAPTEEEVVETEPTEEATEPTVELDDEAVALAILADTSARGKSDTVKETIMWVAINRVEDRSNGYGDTLIYEVNRPKQWQNYDPEGMYLQSTYDLAVKVLDTWRSHGPRPIYNDMLWAVYNSNGSVTVRNKFKDEKGRVEQTFG